MSEETEKKKAWWEIVAALTPLIIGVCVTGVGLLFTQMYNYQGLKINEIAMLEKFRLQLISTDAVEREFAYTTFKVLGYENLALKLIGVRQDSAGRSVVQDIKQNATGTVRAEATATLSKLPVQIYMQLAGEQQRTKAEATREILETKGYVIPSIGKVVGKAPKVTEVRYFNEQDKPIADAIATILREQGYVSAQASPVSAYKVKPGSLEIWLSEDAS